LLPELEMQGDLMTATTSSWTRRLLTSRVAISIANESLMYRIVTERHQLQCLIDLECLQENPEYKKEEE
jgi:hypothetical protein